MCIYTVKKQKLEKKLIPQGASGCATPQIKRVSRVRKN